ncbi:MAG TPA: VOC family protein [Stellaceae bacterium]|nr:VOC family protein [Stellaceae bacterium]
MDADRQLPLAGEIFLDHIAHFVRNADDASKALVRAGFAATPISIQTNDGQLTGTGNVTAMLARGYMEILFKTADTVLGKELDNALARYPGVHLIALSVADARAASARLKLIGFRVSPIVELRRPVANERGPVEAAFTVARVEPGEMAEGRIQLLTHHTEDAVWQKRWLTHPNGAKQLLDAVIAVADIGETAARYERFTGRKPVATRMGRSIFLDRGSVQILDASTFTRLVPGVPVPGLPFIGAYAVRVDSLLAAANVLRAQMTAFEQRDRMLFVPFPKELGAGAWIFVEQPSDLPWRAAA